MGVTGGKSNAGQIPERRAFENTEDQPLSQTLTSKGFQNKDIQQITKSCEVCHQPGKSALLPLPVQTETQRVFQGDLDGVSLDARTSVGRGEKPMDHIDVQQIGIGADLVAVTLPMIALHHSSTVFASGVAESVEGRCTR